MCAAFRQWIQGAWQGGRQGGIVSLVLVALPFGKLLVRTMHLVLVIKYRIIPVLLFLHSWGTPGILPFKWGQTYTERCCLRSQLHNEIFQKHCGLSSLLTKTKHAKSKVSRFVYVLYERNKGAKQHANATCFILILARCCLPSRPSGCERVPCVLGWM